ncbi:hypothetical protein MOP88_01520 [Sphingomonas sp. WKB10]|nr:hypothetical protein [Sphingomonas sp. WKB10]
MQRRIVDHLGEYDWDGTLADTSRDICALLSEADYRDIARCFWDQYLSLPATQAVRHLFHGDRLERRMRESIEYARLKYGDPFDDGWVRIAHRHADQCMRSNVPCPACRRRSPIRTATRSGSSKAIVRATRRACCACAMRCSASRWSRPI